MWHFKVQMIQIKEKAFKKMKEYVQQMGDTEIGGLLTGRIKGEDLQSWTRSFKNSCKKKSHILRNGKPLLESVEGQSGIGRKWAC